MEEISGWEASPNYSGEWSPRPDRCSDVDVGVSSPTSSNFSSCDGSDFDRYCSANSVLGSASICSSIGNYSGIGDEFPSEGYNARGKFMRSRSGEYECLSDGGAQIPRATDSCESPLARTSTSSRLIQGSTESSSSCYGICGKDNTENLQFPYLAKGKSSAIFSSQGANVDWDLKKNEEIGTLNEISWNRKNGSHLDIDIERVTKFEMNEDALSQSRLSESEDSMLDYETDNEGKTQFCHKNFKLAEQAKDDNLNPLFVSSSVAFGSDDWGEFVQYTEGGCLDSLSLHLDQSFHHQDKHIEIDFEEKAEDTAEASFDAKNLAVKDARDDNYTLSFNHESQTLISSICSVPNSLEADPIDLPAKKPEFVTVPGLHNTLSEGNEVKYFLNSLCDTVERKVQASHGEDEAIKGILEASEKKLKEESVLPVDTVASSSVPMQMYYRMNGAGEKIMRHELDRNNCALPLIDTCDGSNLQRVQGKDPSYSHLTEVNISESEVKKLHAFDSYDEMVLEMEEILLDSGNYHESMNLQNNHGYVSQQPHHFGDGSSIASTSASDDIHPPAQVSSKIDRVEVIGAKQKKGDVSFGERLVGVREYTVYQMKVCSGTNEWKVERRYRDFFALYRQLKALFICHGLSLPSAWSNVDQESRKIFGNASPNVVLERSILIEGCLRSILNSRYPFGTPSPLVMFLTPGKAMFRSGMLQSLAPQYLQKFAEDKNFESGKVRPKEKASPLGSTISLVVEIKPRKSLRQLLEIQHYTCAGCHRHLDAGKTLFRELVQTFGWNKPRFCEYTGQLFCASCHTNDTSVLPARVLHHWDFTLYPVSQLSKAYLESIFDQPMLCVSAVNPFLFSKVPALLHVMGFRKKIGAMLPYVNCSFKGSIQKSLGFRKHLLESNDFFTLRDLVDLSKGPFAALPMMVENISDLIVEHITQQCLICYDSGVPCAARQACQDPSSLIFPFQEANAEKCTSCGSIFHKACYVDLLGCPRCNLTALSKISGPTEPPLTGSHREPAGFLERSIHPLIPNSSTGFFTNILNKVKPDKIWKHKSSSPVILMGSLPSSSL